MLVGLMLNVMLCDRICFRYLCWVGVWLCRLVCCV